MWPPTNQIRLSAYYSLRDNRIYQAMCYSVLWMHVASKMPFCWLSITAAIYLILKFNVHGAAHEIRRSGTCSYYMRGVRADVDLWKAHMLQVSCLWLLNPWCLLFGLWCMSHKINTPYSPHTPPSLLAPPPPPLSQHNPGIHYIEAIPS